MLLTRGLTSDFDSVCALYARVTSAMHEKASAVSAFSSRKVFLSFPDIRKQSHLPYFLMHKKRFPLQFFCQALYSDVLHMHIFPAPDAIHVPAEIFGSVPAHGTSGLFHWDDL